MNMKPFHHAAAVAAMVVASTGQAAFAQAGPAPSTGEGKVQSLRAVGLTEPVEIIKDKWGVSHIYAKNQHDLFFGQGYNAARDRLFQMEMWRRQAHGTLAEVLGPSEVTRDIGNRLFQYRGSMKEELERYHPDAVQIVDAFVAGVNAYIEETERDPALLPPEFRMLNFKPGRWTPETVVTRYNALAVNSAEEDLLTAKAVAAIGADAVKDLQYYQNGDPDLTLDSAIDPSIMGDEVLELYKARLQPIKFKPEQLQPQYRRTAAIPAAPSLGKLAYADPRDPRADKGSNNWVVGGGLTTGGYPLVVGDPHRSIEIPSVRYWVHLNAPGWNVIGAGEAMVPGVSIGHNEHGSWGLTIFGTDMEDIYVYDLNPENPRQYKYGGKWETMRVVRETINVKGQAPQDVELMYTRHGPVQRVDTKHNKAYAIRAAWLEPGGAPYMASLRMDQARNVEEFLAAASYMRVPSENMIWGDREGNIAYQATAIQPRRPNWSGLVPVPGDGRYEWNGFLPVQDLPRVVNPAKGYINTSNENQIPLGFPHKDAVGYTWSDPYRGLTVAETLGSGRKFGVADMANLQNSDYSIPARTLVPLLKDLTFAEPAAQVAAARLLQWNYVLDKDSVEAGIYEMFQRKLIANVRETVVPAAAKDLIGPGGINIPMTRILALTTAPDGRFGADPLAGRDALLEKSLSEAVADLKQRFGADMTKWKLGAFHYALLSHPMSGALSEELEKKYSVGPTPRGGDSYTISATFGGDRQVAGGSFKLVIDTENWDNSVGMSMPGQSGNPEDPHYRDLFKLWAEGRYFPVLYSRSKIESAKGQVFNLSPK